MLWIVTCKTAPNMETIREKTGKEHLAYMDAQKAKILLAGSIRSDDGKSLTGAHFILNVNSRAEAKAFSDGDPYVQTGVFTDVTIFRMNKGRFNAAAAEGA